MLLASSLCASLLLLSCAEQQTPIPDDYVDGWDGQEDGRDLTYQEFLKKRQEAIDKVLPPTRPPCNVPLCQYPACLESGPPPFCPRNVTVCRSGCASIEYCKDHENRTFLYQTKFCRTPRRFSPDDNFFSTSEMSVY